MDFSLMIGNCSLSSFIFMQEDISKDIHDELLNEKTYSDMYYIFSSDSGMLCQRTIINDQICYKPLCRMVIQQDPNIQSYIKDNTTGFECKKLEFQCQEIMEIIKISIRINSYNGEKSPKIDNNDDVNDISLNEEYLYTEIFDNDGTNINPNSY